MSLKQAVCGLLLLALINAQGWFALLVCPHCSGRAPAAAPEVGQPEGSHAHACCAAAAPAMPSVVRSDYASAGCSFGCYPGCWSVGSELVLNWPRRWESKPLQATVTACAQTVRLLVALTRRSQVRSGTSPPGNSLYLLNAALLI